MLYIVTYELKSKEKDYDSFFQIFRDMGANAIQCMKDTWLISTDKSNEELFKIMKKESGEGDGLLIGGTNRETLSGWVPENVAIWLKEK